MRNPIIEISLISILVLSARVPAAETSGRKVLDLAREKARVEQVLGGLRQRAALGRSVSEFADELSLFDNQLYGRVRGTGESQSRLVELKSDLESMNKELDRMNAKSPGDYTEGSYAGDGENTLQPQDDQTLNSRIGLLEDAITTTNRELEILQENSLPEAGTELLDGAVWSAGDNLARDAASLEELVKIYEDYSGKLDKLIGEGAAKPAGSGKEKKSGVKALDGAARH